MPRLGATFVPGGYDDYYMPEVIAPAPQRVMPEVPQNMQEDLQRMELEANDVDPKRPNASAANSQYLPKRNEEEDSASYVPARESDFKPFQSKGPDPTKMDVPSFSPFPSVQGENIPPNNEEREQTLWKARAMVLHSNDVAMQVAWARDTLIWVEIAAEAHARDWKREGKGRERPATPKTEHDLRVDAVSIIDHLAQQNHPDACFMKGKWFEFGKFGYREDKREAYSLFRKAAENGCGRAEYRMGMLYENSNDVANAIKHYNLGVRLGDTASNYRLGMMHLMGQHGHQKDILQGLDMIHMAANTADEDAPQGAYVYGMLISRELPDVNIPEENLSFDIRVARQYIEKAAFLGFSKAQLKMGQAYELSQLGCDFNPAYSLHYYGLAARQGQPEAALGVSRWFLFGFESYFPKNEQLAFKYAQDAANAGLVTGEFAMGYYYEIGIHVPKDIREARKWYELAAEHGNKDAKGRLESLNHSKTLTKQDHETTTLTRIKSQHGSQRGKRPDRFSRPADVLPPLSESGRSTPDNPPPPPDKSPRGRPLPTIHDDHSVAPYPEEDRPSPLNLTLRPKSTAPYPDDDVMGHNKPPLSPHYNPGIRPSSAVGPHADRPGSAFGIRPISPNYNPQQNTGPQGRLQPNQPQGGNWAPQVPSGYRQPSPGPARQQDHYRQDSGSGHWQPQHNLPSQQQPQRMGAASAGPGAGVLPAGMNPPIGDPTRTRLQKQNPNYNKPQPAPQQNLGPPGGYPQSAHNLPPTPPAPARSQDETMVNGQMPVRRLPAAGSTASLPGTRMSSGPTGGGAPLKSRPGLAESLAGPGGRNSAPPGGAGAPGGGLPGRPGPGPHPSSSPAPSVASTTKLPGHGGPKKPTDHPDGKTIGQGPATFEEMGIPQGKNDSDCVSV
ncbi:hypothetical protein B0T17DRAFT_593661 [Bombardia bombarda]|uniref:Uncharacterized protein n=1 Tax=Bombardia bombarda TaxID=252184 RepID=A0AA39TKG2_9PEZI|nr:hypothetical protein B0T17DRAFT_593661 [Bombardia bombarda]